METQYYWIEFLYERDGEESEIRKCYIAAFPPQWAGRQTGWAGIQITLKSWRRATLAEVQENKDQVMLGHGKALQVSQEG